MDVRGRERVEQMRGESHTDEWRGGLDHLRSLGIVLFTTVAADLAASLTVVPVLLKETRP
jgi:hypothetical protein